MQAALATARSPRRTWSTTWLSRQGPQPGHQLSAQGPRQQAAGGTAARRGEGPEATEADEGAGTAEVAVGVEMAGVGLTLCRAPASTPMP